MRISHQLIRVTWLGTVHACVQALSGIFTGHACAQTDAIRNTHIAGLAAVALLLHHGFVVGAKTGKTTVEGCWTAESIYTSLQVRRVEVTHVAFGGVQ